MGLSHELSCEGGRFSHCCNPPRFLQSEVFEALFPHTGTWGCAVCFTPQLFLLVYPHTNVGQPSLHAATSTVWSSLLWLPVFAPPSSLNECFFFNSLVVGLPYSSIFWQFWLFFGFKFVVLLFIVLGGKVYLPTPPSWPEVMYTRI